MDSLISEELALANEAVQIQVSSDYNFHSEESFKINYWTRVVAVLSRHLPRGPCCALTVVSLKSWWQARVSKRSLPGLNKVLFAATSLSSFSQLKTQYDAAYSSGPVKDFPNSFSLLKTLFSKLWTLFAAEEEEEKRIVPDDEILMDTTVLQEFGKKVLAQFQQEEDSFVVAEEKVLDFVKSINQQLVPADSPFVALTDRQLLVAAVAVMTHRLGAKAFVLDGDKKCLKLPPRNASAETPPVTDAERAMLMYELAMEKLVQEESALTNKWTLASEKIHTHLQASRKPLALAALRERKQIEKRIEDLGNFRLKLEETASLTQTAIMQQTVVSAIAVGAAAARTNITVDHVSELMETVAEMQEQIAEVNLAFASEEDSGVLEEYARMVTEQEGDKTAVVLPQMDSPAYTALLDSIPSVPANEPEWRDVQEELLPS